MTFAARPASPDDAAILAQIYNEGIEDRVGITMLDRLGAVLGHAEALPRRHASAVVEADEFRAGGRVFQIFDDRDVLPGLLQQRERLAGLGATRIVVDRRLHECSVETPLPGREG